MLVDANRKEGFLDQDETSSHRRLILPDAPATSGDAVKAWADPVVMRTYLPQTPYGNPIFLEKRVYQGSSGRVYPLPVIDRIDTEPVDHAWRPCISRMNSCD